MCLDDTFDTISWWVYELDFGEKGDDCITVDGECISLKQTVPFTGHAQQAGNTVAAS